MQGEYQLLLLRKDWCFLHSIPGTTATTTASTTATTSSSITASATATSSITAEGLTIIGIEKYEDDKHFIK